MSTKSFYVINDFYEIILRNQMSFFKTDILKKKHFGRDINKFSENITGAMGQGISDVFISPISALTNVGTGAFSDITSSPLLYVMVAGLAFVVVKGLGSAERVSNTALENPESLKVMAEAIK